MSFASSGRLTIPRASNRRTHHVANWRDRVCPAAFLTLMLSLLVGCSGPEAGKDNAAKSPQIASPTQVPSGARAVRLDPGAQERLHLQVVPLAPAAVQPEVKGYGKVLDAAPLSALFTELASAQATLAASQNEYQRVKTLAARDNASERALEAARAAAERDRLLVQSARERIALSWGRAISDRSDLQDLVRRLAALEDLLVRIDLPAGEALASEPVRAHLASLREEAPPAPAQFLSRAPSTDPQIQGQGFLFLMKNSLQLAPEAAVTGYLELRGEALQGVSIPRSAVVLYQRRTWVYVEVAPQAFERKPVDLAVPVDSGWFVTEGLRPGDRILVSGAQVLLSEELKSQLQLGD
jgi:hypothetical protein